QALRNVSEDDDGEARGHDLVDNRMRGSLPVARTPTIHGLALTGVIMHTDFARTSVTASAAGGRRARRRLPLRLLLALALLTLSTPLAAAAPLFPLKVGPSGRYLVDQNNVPFLIAGESPQAMIGNLSLADAELFFVTRKAQGFNTVLIDLLCAS